MRIRVDTSVLRQFSNKLSDIGNILSQVGQGAFGKADSAPTIEGQFGPQVRAIGHEALARAQSLFGQMNDQAGQLQRKANDFDAADLASISGMNLTLPIMSRVPHPPLWERLLLSWQPLLWLILLRKDPFSPLLPIGYIPPKPSNAPNPIDNSKQYSIEQIMEAIHTLDVENAERYRAKDGKTYCNIFVMDFCKKMGIPLPDYLDWDKDGKIDDYLNANEAINWIRGTYNHGGVSTGPEQGWASVGAVKAAQLASKGYVVLATWENPKADEPGHIAVVRPESQPGDIMIAQAGRRNFESGKVGQGFGTLDVIYYAYKPPLE